MMPPLRLARVVLLSLACLTGGPGCSLLFAKGPPKRPAPQQPVKCATTYTRPILDGLLGGLVAVTTILYLANIDGEDQSGYLRTTGVAHGIALTGLYTISMAVGINRVGRCHQLLDARARAQQEEEEEEDEDEDQEDVVPPAKAAGKAAPASQPAPESPTVTPLAAPGQ